MRGIQPLGTHDPSNSHRPRENHRVLITGGCGFIGVNLCACLASAGHEILILDDLSTGRREWIDEVGPSVAVEIGDVRDPTIVERATEGVNTVVHLAASAGVPRSLTEPVEDFDVNVHGTLNVLEAARRQGVKRVIVASSNAAGGPPGGKTGVSVVPHPASPYGAGKLAAEAYCSAYHESYGIETLAVRFANVFGPYSTHKTSIVARFLDRILARQALTINGDGQQTRDFVFVDDICGSLVLGLQAAEVRGQVIQVGSGIQTSVLDLVRSLERITGQELAVAHRPPRAGDVRHSVSDLSVAAELLGYRPKHTLEDGLRETWDWFSSRQSRVVGRS